MTQRKAKHGGNNTCFRAIRIDMFGNEELSVF